MGASTQNEKEYISIKAGTIILLVIAIGLLFALPSFAQDAIGIDTPAVEASTWSVILHDYIYPALTTAFLSLLAWLTSSGVKLLNAYLKSVLHWKGVGVVVDALTEVIALLGSEIAKAIADGDLSADDRKLITDKARVLIKDRLLRLSGFYKADLVKWIDEQMDIGLGKLLLQAGLKKT